MLAAARGGLPESDRALAQLFEGYWFPLFAFARRTGRTFEEAQDATQSFFTALIEKEFLQEITQEGGRFRSFLLKAFSRFMANQWRAANSQKRGGRHVTLSINYEQAEQRYQNEPFHEITPERIFERNWALTLIERSLTVLRQEFEIKGKAAIFDQMKACLGKQNDVSYRETAAQSGMTEGAFKTAMHRFRARFAEQLRREIAATVTGPDEVEDELGALFQSLRPGN